MAIWDLPSKRTRAGLSVMTLCQQIRFEGGIVQAVQEQDRTPFNQLGGDAFFDLFSVCAAVTACGSRQKEMMQVQRASSTLSSTCTGQGWRADQDARGQVQTWSHMAVIEAARSDDLSIPGGLLTSTSADFDPTPPIVSASAKQKVAKVLRICAMAAAA